jgi:hypothetical protein
VLKREPVLTVLGGLNGAVLAVLACLQALGVLHLDPTQLAAISGAIIAVTGLATAALRRTTVSQTTYETDVLDALLTPVPGPVAADPDLDALPVLDVSDIEVQR